MAWLVSNHETTTVVIEFLHALKEQCGVVSPKFFMSDDADAFFNAWLFFGGTGEHQEAPLCLACGQIMEEIHWY